MKKSLWMLALLAAGLLCFLGVVALADDEAKEVEQEKQVDVKKLSGKELYKGYCKGCHGEDSPYEEYTPMTLIQEQWDRFFDKKYVKTHQDVADSTHGGEKVTDIITDEMLKKIRKFCIEGAADSEHPMTCG